jgi:hypothetical protein
MFTAVRKTTPRPTTQKRVAIQSFIIPPNKRLQTFL